MRVVMVTDDSFIDRRILQEAESLHSAGHEIILLASPRRECEKFSRIGNIKVERITSNQYSQSEQHALRVANIISAHLSKTSLLANKFITWLSLLSNSAIVSLSGLIKKITDWFIGILYKISSWTFSSLSRASTYFFSISISLVTKTTGLIIKGMRRLRRLGPEEIEVINRIVFYRPDVIHVHDLPKLRACAIANNRQKAHLVYDAHEFYPEQPRLSDKQKALFRRLERKYIKKADVVITVNPLLARVMEKTYRRINIEILENAISPPQGFNPVSGKYNLLRKECRLQSKDKILLYQGWIAPGRNLETIIKGMALVKDTRIKLIIMGYGNYVDQLKDLTQEINLEDRVIFVPSKNQDELLSYTASADIGLIPYPYNKDLNTHYVSPNKLYEFISAGLPILSNNLPFVCQIVETNKFGVCTDLQVPEKFAEAINEFSWSKLRTYRKNLLNEKHLFEWPSESKKLLRIYNEMETTNQAS